MGDAMSRDMLLRRAVLLYFHTVSALFSYNDPRFTDTAYEELTMFAD